MPNPVLLAGLKVFFRLMSSFDRPDPPWDTRSIQSILLINTTALGDTLFSTPAIRAIRLAFPDAKLISLAGPTAKEVLLHNPHLDKIIDHPGRVNLPFFFRLPKLLKTIQKEKCDLAIILHGNDPDAVSLAYLSGAKYRLGWGGSRLAFLLTHRFHFGIPGRHHIEVWQDYLSTLEIKQQGVEMELTISTGEERKAEEYLSENLRLSGQIVGLHPFANKLRGKLWPLARVAELGKGLAEEGYIPVLFGGSTEKKMANEIVAKSDGKIISVVGRLTLRETMALIKRCALFISLDSGPMHIAQALSVPTIALFGPSDPHVTGPLRKAVVLKNEFECSPCGWRPCPYGVVCMESIQVADVLKVVGSSRS